MRTSARFPLVTALALVSSLLLLAVLLSTTTVSATAPPHGHKPLRKDDPRLIPNHKLHAAIPHVYDVKAEYLSKYMREVRGEPNRMTLLVIYASWCGDACNQWVSVLKEVALLMREAQIQHRFQIIKHDITEDDVMMHKLKLEGVPAIGLVEAADHRHWNFIKYDGRPDADAVISFIEQNSPEHAKEAHSKLRQQFSLSKSA